MSDRNNQQLEGDDKDPVEETTDVGEGERGVTTQGRGGTFRSTPGEAGDREGKSGGPDAPIPHRQDG